MKFYTGNMWDMPGVDAFCVTTNSVVYRDRILNRSRAVMGAGVAKEARIRYPGIDFTLASLILTHGHHTQVLRAVTGEPLVYSFPTKYNWRAPSIMSLICQSAWELMGYIEKYNHSLVALPAPGCGHGGLKWEDVQESLGGIFDDRVTIVRY